MKANHGFVPLVLLLLLLPACLVLLRGDGLPCTHDNVLHYYRITAMRDALKHGWLFARWIPNLALGYGYPFFNFREPLPYLLGELLYVAGLPLPLVLGLIYGGCLLGSAWGAYLLARDLFGVRAGWVAAIGYGLGPYLLLDVMRRGNMTESIALALLPWLLWSFRRLVIDGGLHFFVTSTLLLVALFLSHNISSLVFAPFLGSYVLLLVFLYHERKRWPWAFVAVLLALLLSVWFLLPALLEQETVQLHLSRTTRNNDFHYNFATWNELLSTGFTPNDPAYLNPLMLTPLGFARWALALVGLGIGLWRSRAGLVLARDPVTRDVIARERSLSLIFFTLVAGFYLWMSTSASLWLWDAFPILSFVQFPWRLVGRALLPAALLGGAAFMGNGTDGVIARISAPTARLWKYGMRLVFLAVVGLLVVTAFPDMYPPKGFCSMERYPDMAKVYAFENAGWMGVDPESSYFPIWVEQHPQDMALAEAWMRGEEPERFDRNALPAGALVLEASYRPLRAQMRVETPTAFQARWLGLYYPGWQVLIDAAPVEVTPEDNTGFLTFPVPDGSHMITVAFGPTPLRRAVETISFASFVVCVMALGGLAVRRLTTSRKPVGVRYVPGGFLQRLQAGLVWVWQSFSRFPRALTLLALLLLLCKVAFVDRGVTPFRRSRLATGELPDVHTALSQPFDAGLTLLGYTLGAESMPADGELRVDLLWQAHAIPQAEYRAVVLLLGADGQSWSPAGTLRPRGYEPTPPTTQWLPGQYALDPHLVSLLPGTPPGVYRVVVSLFDKNTLTPASVLGPDGNPLGPQLELATVNVLRPRITPDLAALGVPDPDATRLRCGAFGLLTMSLDRQQAAPGDLVSVRWAWEVTLPQGLLAPADPLTVTLALYDGQGEAQREWHFPPAAFWWPSNLWSGGERWVGRHSFYLPAGLQSGSHRVEVRLAGCDQPLAEAMLDVVAPVRSWAVPSQLTPASVVFDSRIRLAGYALEPAQPLPGDTLQVQLAWQALAEFQESYRVFVHLIGPSGWVAAQSDGVPAAWSRPTTGWMVDEVVTETRELALPADLPPGEYRLWVGLYVLDGPRLLIGDGSDAFLLATLDVR
ncbi:MAG: hypothetical protein JXA21_17340 [Anaerolineae bacterium]|nr:hypothetical protein [Anaerolineae bacterium]